MDTIKKNLSNKTDTPPGKYLMEGNHACATAAIAAGCNYFAGYPITPSSEIMEFMAKNLSATGGVFMQMEDEIASIASIIGASWAGAKSMTATSGPGISLMQENIGYAIMTETPCVIVDVQRAGPSTGQATRPAQGDLMQVKWGSQGDYRIIAISPGSVQECFDYTIYAFNLAEEYRVPVFILSDAFTAHLKEFCIIPEEITLTVNKNRPCFGTGKKLLLTGSTHDNEGFRKTTDPVVQERLVKNLTEKIPDTLELVEEYMLEDAEIVIFAYGTTARSAKEAVNRLRDKGVKAGLLKAGIVWPFPAITTARHTSNKKLILVPELNMGQMAGEVIKVSKSKVVSLPLVNGEIMTPDTIVKAVLLQS